MQESAATDAVPLRNSFHIGVNCDKDRFIDISNRADEMVGRAARDGAVEERDLVARLQAEHTEIRHKREEFGNCIDVAAELGDDVPSAVVNDLLVFGWELWDILDHHAHAETYAIQRCLALSVPAGAPRAAVAAHV